MYENLVISGSYISTIIYIGALSVLEKKNILHNIKNYLGTSFSGIILLLLNLNYTVSEIVMIYKNLVSSNIFSVYKCDIINLVNNYGLFDSDNFDSIIKGYLKDKQYNENITLKELYDITDKSLNIVCMNLLNVEEELINYKTHPDMKVYEAIKISCSIPLLFSSVKYKNLMYISGILNNNFPINYYENNVGNTIGLTYINVQSSEINNILDLIVSVIYCLINTEIEENDCDIVYFENRDDVKFKIDEEQININYNYGKNIMEEYINGN